MNPLAEEFIKHIYNFVLCFQLKLKFIIHSTLSATVMEIKLYLDKTAKLLYLKCISFDSVLF
jgi:hypothetical protein